MSSRVSVVVPVYNGEQFVGDALDAIIGQTHTEIELIVVDDGSSDRSVDRVAARLESVADSMLLRQENAGVSAARNAGLAAASSDLVAFCDQDDVWLPRKLERQVEYLALHPEVAVVLVRQEPFFDGVSGAPAWLVREQVFGDSGGVIPCMGLFRREVFARVGTFAEDRFAVDDLTWLLRARRRGVGIGILPEILVRRRIHSANASHDAEMVRSSLFRALHGFAEESRGTRAETL